MWAIFNKWLVPCTSISWVFFNSVCVKYSYGISDSARLTIVINLLKIMTVNSWSTYWSQTGDLLSPLSLFEASKFNMTCTVTKFSRSFHIKPPRYSLSTWIVLKFGLTLHELIWIHNKSLPCFSYQSLWKHLEHWGMPLF